MIGLIVLLKIDTNLNSMNKSLLLATGILAFSIAQLTGQQSDLSGNIDEKSFNPQTLLWYQTPAKIWEEALPVGNGRLGAMVLGKYSEERIQLNEETYWSGGPYNTTVKGGYKDLPGNPEDDF